MNQHAWIAVLACAPAALMAQSQQDGAPIRSENHVFQQAIVMGSAGAQPVVAGMIGSDGRMGLLNVPGKPFSATEERRTVQMLANGTSIKRSEKTQLYRDDQGRTRSEQTFEGKTTIVIMDPVAKTVLILNPDAKTARRVSIPSFAVQGGASVSHGAVTMEFGSSTSGAAHASARMELRANNDRLVGPGPGGRGAPVQLKRTSEELGTQLFNGVVAQGTREIQVIPAASIGADRDLQVVDEHWFSNELQMLLKSTNSDPRFGETTYQLNNLIRGQQDPSLFTVPSDYTMTAENMRMNMMEAPIGK